VRIFQKNFSYSQHKFKEGKPVHNWTGKIVLSCILQGVKNFLEKIVKKFIFCEGNLTFTAISIMEEQRIF
jgi:hypothetical protein